MSAFDDYHDLAARLLGRGEFPLPPPEWDRNYPHNVGLLSDAEESELAARVLKHTRGMSYESWRLLDLGQRLPWIRLAVEHAGIGGTDVRRSMAGILSSLADRARADMRIVESEEAAAWPTGVLDELIADGTLTAIENAKSVTCDSCGHDHVETVAYIESPLRSGLRAYIMCPTDGRIPVPLAGLRRWSVNPGMVPPTCREDIPPQIADEPLSERAQVVLVAMLECGAFDSDQRETTEVIAAKALGDGTDANALKGVLSELKTRGYVQSKTGRGGGCWLTDKGRVRAEKLRST